MPYFTKKRIFIISIPALAFIAVLYIIFFILTANKSKRFNVKIPNWTSHGEGAIPNFLLMSLL